jgi:hypothetical protein
MSLFGGWGMSEKEGAVGEGGALLQQASDESFKELADSNNEPAPEKTGRISQRGKTLRAFRTFLDLLDTAELLRSQLRGPLEAFGLTIPGFRLLEMLYRDGPTFMMLGLEGREQETLSGLLKKLREGDAVKYVKEMMKRDEEWEEGSEW